MTTLSDVVDDVIGYLYGYGIERDKETSLTTAISSPAATTLTVADGAQVDRGLVEIDDELMSVQTSDKSTGTITLQPMGRGARGTTAAIHPVGSRVVNNPRFPRSRVKSTVNMIVSGMYPSVFSIGVDQTNTGRAARITYPVDATADDIISISVQTIGPTQMWRPISRFRFDRTASAGSFSTGRSVDIYESLPPGRPIKIVYRKRFTTFSGLDTQTFADVGLDDNWRDIVALGVESRLISALDGPRLQLGSVESTARAQFSQSGMASQISKQLFNLYQQRLIEEKNRLLRLYPGSIVRMS